jgi:hypothetical protein
MIEEAPNTVNEEMVYDPTSHDNEERVPISERLASQNQALGTEAINLAEIEEQLDGASIARKIFDPEIWKARSEWKTLKDNPQKQEELKQTAEKYLPAIHGEALDYVAAYDSYLHAGEVLSEGLSVGDAKPMSIEEFISTIDEENGKGYAYDRKMWFRTLEQNALPTDEEERRKYFEQSGAVMAIKDILIPHLEVKSYKTAADFDIGSMQEIYPPKEFDVRYSELPGGTPVSPGGRFPKLELSLTDQNLKEEELPPGKEYVIAITNKSPGRWTNRSGFEEITTMRYIPVSENVAKLIDSIGSACDGSVKMMQATAMKSGATVYMPVADIKYEFSVAPIIEVSGFQPEHTKAA